MISPVAPPRSGINLKKGWFWAHLCESNRGTREVRRSLSYSCTRGWAVLPDGRWPPRFRHQCHPPVALVHAHTRVRNPDTPGACARVWLVVAPCWLVRSPSRSPALDASDNNKVIPRTKRIFQVCGRISTGTPDHASTFSFSGERGVSACDVGGGAKDHVPKSTLGESRSARKRRARDWDVAPEDRSKR